jgi:hypothetical protein
MRVQRKFHKRRGWRTDRIENWVTSASVMTTANLLPNSAMSEHPIEMWFMDTEDHDARLVVELSLDNAQQIIRELQSRVENIQKVRARYPNWGKPSISPEELEQKGSQ